MSLVYFFVSAVFFSIVVVTVNEGRNDGRIVFPDSIVNFAPQIGDANADIPLNLIRQLNEVSDDEELMKNLLDLADSEGENRSFGGFSQRMEHGTLKAAKMAKCMPELQTVCLKPNKTSATFYYPSCTRVEKCGGCCSHHLLSCQPVESKIIPMIVVVADYMGGNKLQFRGKRVIEVEEHTKCKCECKIRPETCTRYQTYNPDKCQCECTNVGEERRCQDERAKKLWNTENCSCMCREEFDCSTGYYFDPFICSCVSYRSKKKSSFLYKIH